MILNASINTFHCTCFLQMSQANPQWLVSSNVFFFLAAFELLYVMLFETCNVPLLLVLLVVLTPLISCWYHTKEIQEQSVNGQIPIDTGQTLQLCECDMAVVITLGLLGVWFLAQQNLYLPPICLLIILIWYMARQSNWNNYIILHSIWHITAGLVLLYALYLIKVLKCRHFLSQYC